MWGNHEQWFKSSPVCVLGRCFFTQFVGQLPTAALIKKHIAAGVSEHDIWGDIMLHIQYLPWGN